jgi:anthranilate synthase component 2
MILVIDNYDSFTYNLVHYIGEFEKNIKVVRNDQLSVEQVLDMKPDKIVISPGPCTPSEAGISVELIQSANVPILGVCLGHQSIGAAFGGNIIKANELYHGKKSNIQHSGDSIFSGIEELYSVVRYHSLIVEKNTLPKELKIIATLENDTDVIMAIEHENKPIYGVQFHPESIDTEYGMRLIQNFISI